MTLTTTFSSIGFTFFGGLLVLTVSWLAFALALRYQSPCVAPRATARPRTVIYNRNATINSIQHRGNLLWGWIFWTLSLSYDTMLRGVPGTGTRQGGLTGRLLRTNLDGIVLLRFHAIGRRVATLATLLCVGVLLPLYKTSPTVDCSQVDNAKVQQILNVTRVRQLDLALESAGQRQTLFTRSKLNTTYDAADIPRDSSSSSIIYKDDDNDDEYHGMKDLYNDPCHAHVILTDYGKTTLANVPIMIDESYVMNAAAAASSSSSLHVQQFLLNYRLVAIAIRLYAVVIVLWILTLHVLYLLKQEWIDLLALRRVYYLESDVWKERKMEGMHDNDNHDGLDTQKPKETKHAMEATDESSIPPAATGKSQQIHRRGAATSPRSPFETTTSVVYSSDEDDSNSSSNNKNKNDDESDFQKSLIGLLNGDDNYSDSNSQDELLMNDREPWIPHPEQPDTVAHVGLYSLLVGNLPTLPELKGDKDGLHPDSHTFHNPIYSHLSSKRDCIDWQLSMTAAFFDYCVPNQPGFSSSVAAVSILPGAADITVSWRKWYAAAAKLRRLRFIRKQIERRKHQHILRRRMSLSERGLSASERCGMSLSERTNQSNGERMSNGDDADLEACVEMVAITPNTNGAMSMSFSEQTKNETRSVLGPIVLDDADNKVYESVTFGPEQIAIYGREFAQAASPCCPNGFCEQWVVRASLEELLDYEEEAAIQLHHAICELQDARCHVSAVAVDERGVPLNATPTANPSPRSKKGYKKLAKDYDRPEISRSSSQLETTLLETSGHSGRQRDQPKSKWKLLESIVDEARDNELMHTRELPNGVWSFPTCAGLLSFPCLKDWRKHFQTESAVESLARESSFAVVTFTSRQAAIAARHCLSDGRAFGRWSNMHEIPIAPLSDAAPFNIMLCRNCCRPVTLSISDGQKSIRFYLTLILLACLYVFYTIPLTFASSLVNPELFEELFPYLQGTQLPHIFTGFLSAMVWSIFFMICPQLFRTIANFGSVATSVAKAERRALQYFWWFMVFTAFTGPILAQWVLNAIDNDFQFGAGLREALRLIAGATSTVVSANWLNWIIYRFTIIIPIHYMLQFNTFLFQILGLKCLSRLTIGGGPGGPIPYRIFVDSGVVIMCTVALAPVCPVVAPAALLYFYICEPILRRNLIFIYRPRYDDGGLRWTFLFDMIISGLVMAQILLSVQMTLKNAYGPMLFTASAVPVTVFFSYYCKRKYSTAFHDAALLQTALLDGWDKSSEMNMDDREQYRRFLVDAHRASFIPICIAGADTGDYLTAEPAVVVPRNALEEEDLPPPPPGPPLTPTQVDHSNNPLRARSFSADHAPLRQPGATLRRADSGVAAWLESQDRDVDDDGFFDGEVPDMIDDFLSTRKKLK